MMVQIFEYILDIFTLSMGPGLQLGFLVTTSLQYTLVTNILHLATE